MLRYVSGNKIIKMKRQDKDTVGIEPKAKRVKKSVKFSEKVNVNEKALKGKIKTGIADKKKKVKLQKPTTAVKKTEKIIDSKKVDKIIRKKTLPGKDGKLKIGVVQTATEKPDWLEYKKQKKELKEKRKAKRLTEAYDVTVKAKQLGEKLRRTDCTKEMQNQLTTELYQLLKGQFSRVVFLHDIARIVQWMIKHCTPDIRESIVTELKYSIVPMLQSKYAKNCIKTIMHYGTAENRATVIAAFNGNVVKLAGHSLSAPIIEYAYSSWATDTDKVNFKQEFYGDIYKQVKDNNIKSLSDVYKLSEDMKSATLAAVKGNLVKIFNKKLTNVTLVHSVLLDFLRNCNKEDRSEMIVMFRSLIAELSKSKDGAKSAMICLWHGTNKDRKAAMKTLKDQVMNMATSEHGHMVLMALFDCIDDTVLVKKMILTELQNHLVEISSSEYGRSVILYLVARRDPRYFHPKLVEELQEGDDNETSKKPADLRAKELLEAVVDKFLETISADAAIWLSSSSISMVTLAILKAGDGEKLKNAYETIANYITDSESVIKENETEYKVIEYAGLHLMLKKLIQNDKTRIESGKSTFGEVLVEKLNPEIIKQWIEYNRACFILITLIENSGESTADILLNKLKAHKQSLKSKKTPGASILLKKLK